MTTLTLYKGVAFDGVNSFPYIPSNRAVFDGYLSRQAQYAQAIHFNRIGEPILINEGYNTAIEYSYGCIDTGDKKYFIIPDSISVNEHNRVYLSYSVDWFTTLEYADAITFGRSHLIKSTDVDPLTSAQSISPIDMMVTEKIHVADDLTKYGSMMVSYVKDDSVNFIHSPCLNFGSFAVGDEFTLAPFHLYNGDFFTLTGIRPVDIINAWYVPIRNRHGNSWVRKTGKTEGGVKYAWWHSDIWAIGAFNQGSVATNITTDNMHKGVIADRNGNVVYTVPYGRTLTQVEYGVALSTTQCYIQLKLSFSGQSSAGTPDRNVENAYVLIPCDTIDYINDTYLNWSMGMKGIEIEERRIQKNKALVEGLANAGLTGIIGGAPSLTSKDTAKGWRPVLTTNVPGAMVGAAAGFAGPALSYGLDTYYESNINRIEDRKYQLAQDEIIPGSFIPNDGYRVSVYQLSASAKDIARYNAEISNFGADCNLPVSSWTPSVGAYKFMDVEVIADVPYSIKESVKSKLTSGIKIVELN